MNRARRGLRVTATKWFEMGTKKYINKQGGLVNSKRRLPSKNTVHLGLAIFGNTLLLDEYVKTSYAKSINSNKTVLISRIPVLFNRPRLYRAIYYCNAFAKYISYFLLNTATPKTQKYYIQGFWLGCTKIYRRRFMALIDVQEMFVQFRISVCICVCVVLGVLNERKILCLTFLRQALKKMIFGTPVYFLCGYVRKYCGKLK
ncbi:hypothetical protein F4703DRAFT_1793038 [Phycomyces blakesleeanus]